MAKGRINLTPRAAQALGEMLDETKRRGECVKTTASGLASWIVSHFKEKHFKKQRETICRAHFDRRAYLRNVLKGTENDEGLDEALRQALQKKGRKTGQQGL